MMAAASAAAAKLCLAVWFSLTLIWLHIVSFCVGDCSVRFWLNITTLTVKYLTECCFCLQFFA